MEVRRGAARIVRAEASETPGWYILAAHFDDNSGNDSIPPDSHKP